eukprot:Lankesteria_metandrocarpae@DN3941_c0_g1_i4.p1
MKTLDVSLRNKPEEILKCLQRYIPEVCGALQRILGVAATEEESNNAVVAEEATALHSTKDVDVWTLPMFDNTTTNDHNNLTANHCARVWRLSAPPTTAPPTNRAAHERTQYIVDMVKDRHGRYTQEKHHPLSQLVYTYEVAADLCDLHVRNVRRCPSAVEVHIHAAVVFSWLDLRKACRHLSTLSILSPLCAGGDARFWALWARLEYVLAMEEIGSTAASTEVSAASHRRILQNATKKALKRLKYGRNAHACPVVLLDAAEKAIACAALTTQPQDHTVPMTSTPPVATPIAAPPVGAPIAAPPVATPIAAPPVGAPIAAPPVATPIAAPPVATPIAAPPVGAPIAAPPVAAPIAAPPVATPIAAPPVGAPIAAPPVGAPIAAPPVATPI